MGRTIRLVVGIPRYAGIAAVAAFASLTTFTVTQNLGFTWFALTGPLSPVDRVTILLELYPFVGTFYSPLVGSVLIGVAGLVGVDVALLWYHLAHLGASARSSSSGLVGVVLGVLGAGCAACGSVLLAGVLSLVGGAGALTALPLDGLEFALVGTVPLVLSVFWITDGMRGREVAGCPIDVQQ